MNTTARHNGRGFTLIELVAVMVVLGILAAAATIQTRSVSAGSRLGWAARSVARDLSFARERAMTTGSVHWVRFDPSNQYYTVLAESATTPGFAGAEPVIDPATQGAMVVRLNRGDWTGLTLSAGGTFSTIGYTVGFSGEGRPLVTSGGGLGTQTGPTLQAGTAGPAGGVAPGTAVTVVPGTGRIVY